ncbi:MAG TPA: signal peptidase I [Verrucomicrobiae bacterium]|nr:signal peptidase I [Verrucomicrobiae bacterium]
MKAEVEESVAGEKEARQAGKHAGPATTKDKVWSEVVSWFWVILAFLVIEGTLVQARVIPSGSMENTVLIGDHLIVSRIGYDAGIPFTNIHVPLWRNPKRQQIIVFRAPLPEEGYPDFIKRVIGIPGDHIKIVNGKVYVNDKPLNEPYVLHDDSLGQRPENYPPVNGDAWAVTPRPDWAQEISKHIVNGELVVPPGEYFMMGDNRDNSYDSRYWGFVPRENIIGTPVLIYMSINGPGGVWDPGHVGERFETYLSAILHPSEIRWNRLFHTF